MKLFPFFLKVLLPLRRIVVPVTFRRMLYSNTLFVMLYLGLVLFALGVCLGLNDSWLGRDTFYDALYSIVGMLMLVISAFVSVIFGDSTPACQSACKETTF